MNPCVSVAYGNTTDRQCYLCDANCLTCANPDGPSTNCTTCLGPTLFLKINTCVTDCGNNWYANTTNQVFY